MNGAQVHVNDEPALRYAEAFRTFNSSSLMSITCLLNGISQA